MREMDLYEEGESESFPGLKMGMIVAQSTGVWQFGKLGRSEGVGQGEPEME